MIFIYGGSGSGKSAYGEQLALSKGKEQQLLYLATLESTGKENQARIQSHLKKRKGKNFLTIEKPCGLAKVIEEGYAFSEEGKKEAVAWEKKPIMLLESCSSWVANEMFLKEGKFAAVTNWNNQKEEDFQQMAEELLQELQEILPKVKELILVSDDVFRDGVVYQGETKAYQKLLGCLHQKIARVSDEVIEVVVGIPCWKKGK